MYLSNEGLGRELFDQFIEEEVNFLSLSFPWFFLCSRSLLILVCGERGRGIEEEREGGNGEQER